MARRSSDNLSVLYLIIGIFLIYLLVKFWYIAIIALAIFGIRRWYLGRLMFYNNNLQDFYLLDIKPYLRSIITILSIIIVISTSLFIIHLSNLNQENKLIAEQILLAKEETERQLKINQIKNDSAAIFITISKEFIGQKEYRLALLTIDSALQIVPNNLVALDLKANIFENTGKYNGAIKIYNTALNQASVAKDIYELCKGKCYLKTGNKLEAVRSFFTSAKAGNSEASQLYNKHNPMVKEVIGYITKCCDGTSSYAKGRGACSHHGGVCKWNSPITRERRKYNVES